MTTALTEQGAAMTHVNVRQRQPDDWRRGFVVEVSVDGASFLEHWFLATRGDNQTDARLSASSDGRIYAAGIKFGGREVRMTAFGDDVHVPDMTTIGWHTASNSRANRDVDVER